MNRLPATDRGDDLDAVCEMFQYATKDERTALCAETIARIQELPIAVIVAVLMMSGKSKELAGPAEEEMKRRGRTDTADLLRGLR